MQANSEATGWENPIVPADNQNSKISANMRNEFHVHYCDTCRAAEERYTEVARFWLAHNPKMETMLCDTPKYSQTSVQPFERERLNIWIHNVAACEIHVASSWHLPLRKLETNKITSQWFGAWTSYVKNARKYRRYQKDKNLHNKWCMMI